MRPAKTERSCKLSGCRPVRNLLAWSVLSPPMYVQGAYGAKLVLGCDGCRLLAAVFAAPSLLPANFICTQKVRTKCPERTVVILIHGIRTEAAWQSRVASILEQEAHATVIPLKYGYFDAIRFWCPFDRVQKRSHRAAERSRLRVFAKIMQIAASSYLHIASGRCALSRILLADPFFTFDRIILCGSIVRQDFDWRRVENENSCTGEAGSNHQ